MRRDTLGCSCCWPMGLPGRRSAPSSTAATATSTGGASGLNLRLAGLFSRHAGRERYKVTDRLEARVGMLLAVLMNWDALRFRNAYQVLLFLPYAVPGFISILVFKGLFNNNFGEINLILSALFGIKPAWFSDPLLAKVMILIVNTWLGHPPRKVG